MADPISPSPLDSRRFGVRVFRARVEDEETAQRLIALDSEHAVDLAIARTPTHRLDLAQVLERGGFFLCDTLIYYRGPVGTEAMPAGVRPATESDRGALESLARSAFSAFGGHYHQDARLDGKLATEGYVEWCLSALAEPRGFVLVAEEGADLAGFVTVKHESQVASEIVLNGVAPAFQRRGVYDRLVRATRARLGTEGFQEVFSSTQLTNLGPQKVWVRNGLQPAESFHTFHRWYDESRGAE